MISCVYNIGTVDNMIDALFGSRTRVKLLHLFMNNPGKSFYVREITRLIDEQINSVRRELSNLLEAGVITSSTADNRLYYQVNQLYEHYSAFRAIFGDQKAEPMSKGQTNTTVPEWQKTASRLNGARVVVAAGVLVKGSAGSIDLLIVGDTPNQKVNDLVQSIEAHEGRELNYTTMKYDEFYYRLSVHDRFTSSMLANRHSVLLDTDNILKEQ